MLYRIGSCIWPFDLCRYCITSSRYTIKSNALRSEPSKTPTMLLTTSPYFPASLHLSFVPWRPCVMFPIVCIGRPSFYSVPRRVFRLPNPNAFDRPASMIFVLFYPFWAACSIFTIASIADKPLLYPNWLLDVRRCMVRAIFFQPGPYIYNSG